MGIPRMLYTDNDSVIVSKRMQRAASILDRAFAESGGFKLEQHRAGNPQATGKVERAHQIVEKYEKVFGLSDEPPTLADINRFCEGLCLRKNSLPTARPARSRPGFRNTTAVMRVPPDALLDSAFKVDEFTPVLNPDMTVRLSGERYQLPRKRPFVDWMGEGHCRRAAWDRLPCRGWSRRQRVEIVKQVASTDRAGEFKTPEESSAQQTMKQLEASATERRRVRKASGRRLRRPLIDTVEGTAAPLILPRAKQPLTQTYSPRSHPASTPFIAGRAIHDLRARSRNAPSRSAFTPARRRR